MRRQGRNDRTAYVNHALNALKTHSVRLPLVNHLPACALCTSCSSTTQLPLWSSTWSAATPESPLAHLGLINLGVCYICAVLVHATRPACVLRGEPSPNPRLTRVRLRVRVRFARPPALHPTSSGTHRTAARPHDGWPLDLSALHPLSALAGGVQSGRNPGTDHDGWPSPITSHCAPG